MARKRNETSRVPLSVSKAILCLVNLSLLLIVLYRHHVGGHLGIDSVGFIIYSRPQTSAPIS